METLKGILCENSSGWYVRIGGTFYNISHKAREKGFDVHSHKGKEIEFTPAKNIKKANSWWANNPKEVKHG